MGFLSWIVFGLIAGSLAKWFSPGEGPNGCLVTIVLGVVGAVVGGYLATLLDMGGISGFDVRSMLLAVVGAAIVLWVHRMVTRRK